MKVCLRKKCKKEFEPNKPKQVFCSAKCRVYFSREENSNSEKKIKKEKVPQKEYYQKGEIKPYMSEAIRKKLYGK